MFVMLRAMWPSINNIRKLLSVFKAGQALTCAIISSEWAPRVCRDHYRRDAGVLFVLARFVACNLVPSSPDVCAFCSVLIKTMFTVVQSPPFYRKGSNHSYRWTSLFRMVYCQGKRCRTNHSSTWYNAWFRTRMGDDNEFNVLRQQHGYACHVSITRAVFFAN